MAAGKGKKTLYDWSGENGTVKWDGRLCIHVGECTRSGELFESGRDPWCTPDAAPREDLQDVVSRCPTGALWLESADGGVAETPDGENTVVVANNGPLYVRGRLAIDAAPEDRPAVSMRAALCRCGDSKNKPFCDNTHEKERFTDRGAVGEAGPGPDGARGELTIKRAPNGPLLVNGPFVIRTAAGRAAWSGTKAALCRCGKSANKPFCDGAHKAAGFEAD